MAFFEQFFSFLTQLFQPLLDFLTQVFGGVFPTI